MRKATTRTVRAKTATATRTSRRSAAAVDAPRAGLRALPGGRQGVTKAAESKASAQTVDVESPVNGPSLPVSIDAVWAAYKQTPALALRNTLVAHYLPLVKACAERLAARLPQSIDVQDLQSAGVFGLMKAIDAYDINREAKFETYSSARVTGAMLDELRTVDWVPRQVRTRHTQVERATADLEGRLGRAPEDHEIAKHMKMSVKEYREYAKDAYAVSMTSLDRQQFGDANDGATLARIDVIADRKSVAPDLSGEKREFAASITRKMTSKERLIMVLYYFEDITMKEIGSVLGLSESRVCQIHTRVTNRLNDQVGEQYRALAA